MSETYREGWVSVVTPVYNGALHLAPMLDSVLRQTYSYIEMILVDDGSSDSTMQVAEDYRVRFNARGYAYHIVHSAHKNAAAAINQGLPYVTGEYLVWPDSDDLLEPASIERRVTFLQNHPQYQCVRSLQYYFDQRTGDRLPADEKTGDLSKEELFWDILEFKTFVCCGCYMLRSERFFEIYTRKHIPEFNVGQNFQMLLPYMFYYKCPTISEQLYGVCVRRDSHSRKKLTEEEDRQKYREYEQLADKIASICRLHDEKDLERIRYWKLRRRYMIATRYGDKKQAFSALRQMKQMGRLSLGKVIKDFLWVCLENTWVVKKIYPIYCQVAAGERRKSGEKIWKN